MTTVRGAAGADLLAADDERDLDLGRGLARQLGLAARARSGEPGRVVEDRFVLRHVEVEHAVVHGFPPRPAGPSTLGSLSWTPGPASRSRAWASNVDAAREPFEFFDGPGPVLAEQAGQRAVGEQPPAGLAGGAVVGFASPRSGCAGSPVPHLGHGFSCFPCTDIAGLNAVTLSGNAGRDSSRRMATHLASSGARRLEQPSGFPRRERPGQLERRQPRLEQDLVGVRVADPAEQPGIGQGALQRVVRRLQDRPEPIDGHGEHVFAAGVESAKSVFALDHVERGPPLRSGLRESQQSVRQLEGGQRLRCGSPCSSSRTSAAGLQSSGAGPATTRLPRRRRCACQPPKRNDLLPFDQGKRRRHAAQQERRRDTDADKRLPQDALLERLDVDDDVRKLRHG